jgi:phosphoglycerate kinase
VKKLQDIGGQLAGKTVLMRVDFNLPLDKKTHEITNDLRVRQTLPTIRFVMDRRGRTVLMSHLGRPDGKAVPELSMKRVAVRLSELLGSPVQFVPECIGPEVEAAVARLKDGEVLMLENLRFHAEEEENDAAFARQLASIADYYVDDAFGTAHRAHASTEGVTRFLPSCGGFLIQREVEYLARVVENPDHPFVAIMGGAKVSDKIGAIRNILKKADVLLVGGAMAYTFLKHQGIGVGNSKVEDDKLDLAGELLRQGGDKIILPGDHVCADRISADARPVTVDREIPQGMIGLDIGPKTAELYAHRIAKARLVTWNGPMGYIEIPAFAKGNRRVLDAVAACRGTTIVGGGETAEAVEALGLQDKISHVSTGGGACLDFLAGKKLPGIVALH